MQSITGTDLILSFSFIVLQATLTSLLNRLISRFPSIAAVLERSAIAINEEYVGFSFEAQKLIEKADSARSNSDQNFEGNNDTLLRNNDVVAVIPPVSGG